jgi:hypothetical protein
MSNRHAANLVRQSTAIALSAPQVVAHRLAQFARAGAFPSVRDQREFSRMSAEKVEAFYESWNAMLVQSWHIQQELGMAALHALCFPWQARTLDPARHMLTLQHATARIVSKGMAPVQRRTVANARRLARAGLRRP